MRRASLDNRMYSWGGGIFGHVGIDIVDLGRNGHDALYVDLHQHPELSLQEKETAAKLASRLKALGYRFDPKGQTWVLPGEGDDIAF